MKKFMMLVAAMLFTFSLAYANNHGNMGNSEMSGKSMSKDMKQNQGTKSGSCGAGKCGGDVKKKDGMKSGSCGAGKCGGDKKPKKPSGSCGAGKCG